MQPLRKQVPAAERHVDPHDHGCLDTPCRPGWTFTEADLDPTRTKSGDVSFNQTFTGIHSAPLPLDNGLVHLRILVDTSSVEVFTDKGQVVLTDQIFPGQASNGVSLFATGGTARLVAGVGWHMQSAVPKN